MRQYDVNGMPILTIMERVEQMQAGMDRDARIRETLDFGLTSRASSVSTLLSCMPPEPKPLWQCAPPTPDVSLSARLTSGDLMMRETGMAKPDLILTPGYCGPAPHVPRGFN